MGLAIFSRVLAWPSHAGLSPTDRVKRQCDGLCCDLAGSMALSTRTDPEDLVNKVTPRILSADPPSILSGTDLPSLFLEQAVSEHPHQGRPDAFVEPQSRDRRL